MRTLYPRSVCEASDGFYYYQMKSCPTGKVNIIGPSIRICEDATRIQDCNERHKKLIYQKSGIPEREFIELAEKLEEDDGCAGIGMPCQHFLYSSCTRSKPQKTCDGVIIDRFSSMSFEQNRLYKIGNWNFGGDTCGWLFGYPRLVLHPYQHINRHNRQQLLTAFTFSNFAL